MSHEPWHLPAEPPLSAEPPLYPFVPPSGELPIAEPIAGITQPGAAGTSTLGGWNPWRWDPTVGTFAPSPTASALGYQPDITTTSLGYQQALREALPSWGHRPRVRSYIESLEQPLLGQYYGAMGGTTGIPEEFGSFADWLLKRPGKTIGGDQGYLGGLGAFARPGGLTGTDWSSIGEMSRLLAHQQGVGDIPDNPWAAVLAGNPDAAGALASLATFDPRARTPMGQMRQRAISRAAEEYDVPGMERGGLDWLGYLLGGGAPAWMTRRSSLPAPVRQTDLPW